jgi:hypothetical protein
MITKEQTELLNNYLDDNLNEEDIKAFKLAFETDKVFAREVKQYTNLKVALKSASRVRAAHKPATKIRPMLFYKLAAAASIALLFAISAYYFFTNTDQSINKQLYANYYENPSVNNPEIFTRSASNEIDPQFMEDFLLAINYMENKKFKPAKNLLNQLAQEHQNSLSDDIDWYLALCHLRLGETEPALELFTMILNSNSIHSLKARNIYSDLVNE